MTLKWCSRWCSEDWSTTCGGMAANSTKDFKYLAPFPGSRRGTTLVHYFEAHAGPFAAPRPFSVNALR